jgi:hypothetical protein
VILGEMKPGRYTVYVVSSPLDRLRYVREDFATAEIEFLASDKPAAETPLEPAIPVIAVGVGAALGLYMSRMRDKRK